jgi:uncharacterized membrane protein
MREKEVEELRATLETKSEKELTIEMLIELKKASKYGKSNSHFNYLIKNNVSAFFWIVIVGALLAIVGNILSSSGRI